MASKDNSEEVQSPIVMKVDAPPEDSVETDENCLNEKKVESSKNSFTPKPSRVPVLAKPKLFGNSTMSNPFAVKSSSVVLSSPKLNFGNSSPKPLLRPSKLSQASVCEANNSFQRNPFVLTNNPFTKVSSSTSELNDNVPSESTSTSTSNQEECSSSSDKKPQPITTTDLPKFVPLTVENNASSSTTSNNFQTATPSFVFGQNLHERVVGEAVEGNGIDSTSAIPSSSTAACSNGGGSSSSDSESLFGSAAASDKGLPTSTTDGAKSLSEAAREYEESRAQKRKYEEVQVITGEENEQNVMQIGCKLFAFDQATRNWQERGRGNLRLNDIQVDGDDDGNIASSSNSAKVNQSRLVVRSTGSLRVVLNTKIWSGMSVELASPKSIRLTAMDSEGVVKVFLVMANVKEIEKLFELLTRRVENEQKRASQQPPAKTTEEEQSSKRIAIDSETV